MKKALLAVLICLCVIAVQTAAFAEVKIVPLQGKAQVKSADGVIMVDASNSPQTVTDSTGAKFKITYNAETMQYDVECLSGSGSFTFGSAQVDLTEGQKMQITLKEQAGSFDMKNTSPESITEDIDVVFPDGSRIGMPSGSEVGFTYLADRNYMLNVKSGIVQYTDSNGNLRTLSGSSAGVMVPGFTTLPMAAWRGAELEDVSAGTP